MLLIQTILYMTLNTLPPLIEIHLESKSKIPKWQRKIFGLFFSRQVHNKTSNNAGQHFSWCIWVLPGDAGRLFLCTRNTCKFMIIKLGYTKKFKVYIFKNPEMFLLSVSVDWNYLLCYLEQTFVSVEERNLSNDNFNRNIRQRNIVTLEIFMMKVCLRDVTLIFLHYVLHLSAKTRILPQWEKACSALVKRQ